MKEEKQFYSLTLGVTTLSILLGICILFTSLILGSIAITIGVIVFSYWIYKLIKKPVNTPSKEESKYE